MFIEKVLKTLSKSEKNEFLLFLDRKKRKADRKDISVCKVLMNDMKPKVESANNYHAIRNRIKDALILFIQVKQIETDTTKESELLNEINLCRFLFNNQLEKEAWNYLNKLDKKSLKIKSYRNSYSIYLLMIEFSHTNELIDIKEIVEKKNKVKELLDQEEKLLDTLSIARKRLQLFKNNVQKQSLVTLINEIKNEIDIQHPSFYKSPKQILYYLELIRGSLLYNRDVRAIEPIAIELYNKAKNINGFTSYTLEYELRILYIICHSLYRNQKLELCLKYIENLELLLKSSNLKRYHYYFAKTMALKSSILFLTKNIEESIRITEEFLDCKNSSTKEDELNLKLNLLTFYAYNKQYKVANRFFIQMHHSDGWYSKLMGKEWVFKKNTIEMLLQFKMGKDDIALSRINSIIKANSELTKLRQYKNITEFLTLFKNYIIDPTSVKEEDLLSISKSSDVISLDNEVKKTAFYTWFLALLKDKDPYEHFMSLF